MKAVQKLWHIAALLHYCYKSLPLAGVFLARGVIGANGGGISVGPFLVGVEGTLEGRVPALGFLRGGSIFSSLFIMAFLA